MAAWRYAALPFWLASACIGTPSQCSLIEATGAVLYPKLGTEPITTETSLGKYLTYCDGLVAISLACPTPSAPLPDRPSPCPDTVRCASSVEGPTIIRRSSIIRRPIWSFCRHIHGPDRAGILGNPPLRVLSSLSVDRHRHQSSRCIECK